MAYVRGFQNDVFISYARADNDAASEGGGFVDLLVGDLSRAVKMLLGLQDGESLNVFFDKRDLRGFAHVEDLKKSARSSAVFIAVTSPSYLARGWPRDELDAFCDKPGWIRHVIAVESLPPHDKNDYPVALRQVNRRAFWCRKDNSNTELRLTRGDRDWNDKIQDIAKDITTLLRALRSANGHAGNGLRARIDRSDVTAVNQSRTVLLAQVTDDLDSDREQIRRYLEQFNITVLPRVGYYPQGGDEFTKAVTADLAEAGFFVQLLGPVRGRRPPDLPSGYARHQYELAKEEVARRRTSNEAASLITMSCRRPDIDVASLDHEDVDLVSAVDVMAMSLEAFKAQILEEVERADAPKPKPEERPGGEEHLLVFVNAAQDDMELAAAVGEQLRHYSCTAWLPQLQGPAGFIRRDLERKTVECDALALIYGKAEPDWIFEQLLLYDKHRKTRTQPARVILVCRAPPQPKRPHGVLMPELREIDLHPGARGETSIKQLIDVLRS